MKNKIIALFLFAVVMWPLSVNAFSWQQTWKNLWHRPDQQGAASLAKKQPKLAADQFRAPMWKGVANYQAGNFNDAIKYFSKSDSSLANYNRGNALVKSSKLEAAMKAYDRAIKINPNNTDAKYNKQLVEKILKQKKQQQPKNQKQNKQSKNNKQSNNKQNQQKQNQGQDKDKKDKINKSKNQNQKNKQSKSQQDQSKQNQSQKNKSQSQGGSQQKQQQKQQQKSGAKPGKRPNQKQSQPPTSKEQKPGEKAKQQAQASKMSQHGALSDNKPIKDVEDAKSNKQNLANQSKTPENRQVKQWLKQIPDDPGGLLRNKFLRDSQQQQGTRW